MPSNTRPSLNNFNLHPIVHSFAFPTPLPHALLTANKGNPRHQIPSQAQKQWFRAINLRLAEDQIIATKIKRDKHHLDLVKATWKSALTEHGIPLNNLNWPFSCEVFSG